MINLLRKNQRVLMLVIAILTIVAFILLYNTSQLDHLSTVRDPKIYGRALNPAAIERQVKNYQLTVALGQYDLLTKLGGANPDRSAALNAFVWNLLVLRHEAQALGVEPTVDQVADRIKALPNFQTSGQFDPVKYAAFLRDQLAPRGFTERNLEDVIRDSLRVERIGAIVEAPAAVGDAEIAEAARILQPVTGTVVLFDTAQASSRASVSDEDVRGYFEKNGAALLAEETRAVKYVTFELPAGTATEGKAKIDALQKLADAASAFVEKLGAPGASFESAAAAAGLKTSETPAFNRAGATQAKTPDDAIKGSVAVHALAPAAFLLRGPGATSDVIQDGDTFYVMALSQLSPSRPLTFDEAKDAIRARLKEMAVEQYVRLEGEAQVKAMREALAAGKPIAELAAKAGLKTVPLDNIEPASETVTPEQRAYLVPTLALKDGELSAFRQTTEGGFAVFLKARGPVDEKALAEKRTEIKEGLLDGKRQLLFAEWLSTSLRAANLTVPRSPRG